MSAAAVTIASIPSLEGETSAAPARFLLGLDRLEILAMRKVDNEEGV